MKVGVKYCGGCNPQYDRGKFFQEICEEINEKVEFESLDIEQDYDFIWIICGCRRACVTIDGMKFNIPTIYSTSPEDCHKIDKLLGGREKV